MHVIAPDCYGADERLVVATAADLATIRNDAVTSARGRSRLCAHPDSDAPVHEMLIAHTSDVYVRPHRHHGKDESLLLLEGELDALFFDDAGRVTRRTAMAAYGGAKPFYYRIPPGVWHAIVIGSPLVVFMEVTAGPFRREDTEFPGWAPDGNDLAAARAWVAGLGLQD
jgi:cupin fold WbuC family metalloprotein